jgi:hypothetical protein
MKAVINAMWLTTLLFLQFETAAVTRYTPNVVPPSHAINNEGALIPLNDNRYTICRSGKTPYLVVTVAEGAARPVCVEGTGITAFVASVETDDSKKSTCVVHEIILYREIVDSEREVLVQLDETRLLPGVILCSKNNITNRNNVLVYRYDSTRWTIFNEEIINSTDIVTRTSNKIVVNHKLLMKANNSIAAQTLEMLTTALRTTPDKVRKHAITTIGRDKGALVYLEK